jgi:outer membrane protein OmpA-like peptidoglycan-associated protein
MSISSNGDDTSDIFWPGYVDAVTNLAINLLFVIAVMSIVVIASILQITELSKRKVLSIEIPKSNTSTKEIKDFEYPELEKILKKTQEKLKKTELKLNELEKNIIRKNKKNENSVNSNYADIEPISIAPSPQKNAIPNSTQSINSGVIVKFSPEAIILSAEESYEIIKKIQIIGPLKTSRWQILIISPKGYTEAQRMSYYRANAIRNVLIENGVQGTAIEINIQESSKSNANNSKALIRIQSE